MALNTSLVSVQLLNASITDTAAHTSSQITMDYLDETTVVVISSLNQSVTLATQWSLDGVTWTNIGSTYSLAASSTLVTNQYASDLTGIRVFGGQLRFVATAGTAPTSGSITIQLQGMSN